MNSLGHKCTVRSHHESSHFCIDRNIVHSCGNKNLIILLFYTLSDSIDIIAFLIGLIRDSYATWKVDECDLGSCLLLKIYSELKELSRKLGIILVGYSVTCKESVNTESLGTFLLKDLKCLIDLLSCKSVLGISRVIHDTVTHLENSAGIISAWDSLGNLTDWLLKEINVCEIIKIDDGTKLICKNKLLCRCIVWWEHDLMSLRSYSTAKQKLSLGWAVKSTSFLP